jgi:hypothetical protein
VRGRDRVLRAIVLFAVLAVSACGEEQSAAESDQQTAAESSATRNPEPRVAKAAALPTVDPEEAPQIETQEDVATEPYSLPADDSLADVDLENVEIRLEPTTNIHAAASQLAYLRAVNASWQARQFQAAEAANSEVRAEGANPAPQAPKPAPEVENPAAPVEDSAPQVDEPPASRVGEK